MFTRWSVAVVFLGAVFVSADDTKGRKDNLEGTWKLTRVVNDGKEDPKAVGGRVEIRDGKISGFDPENKQTFVISYRLNPDRKPSEIDMKIVEGKDRGRTAEGIYSLEGDTLKLCYSYAGGKRPREFKSAAGEQQICLEMKRDRK